MYLCFLWRKEMMCRQVENLFLFVASDAFPIFYSPIVYFPFVPLLFKDIWIDCLVSFYSNVKFPWFRNSRNPVRLTSKLLWLHSTLNWKLQRSLPRSAFKGPLSKSWRWRRLTVKVKHGNLQSFRKYERGQVCVLCDVSRTTNFICP